MRTSIATVSVSGTLPEKIAAIAAAGFDGLELFEQDLLITDETPATVRRMIEDHGLALTLYQPFRDFETLPDPYRAAAFDRAERKFDLMQQLGADLMLVCSSVAPQALGGIDRAAADFRELGERSARRGLRVGYEALCWGRHVSDHRDAWEIVRRADHQAIGLVLDSFHSLAKGIDSGTIRSIPGDRIFIVQLADAPLIHMDLLHWSRHLRNMPGEGDLPVKDFVKAIYATGYEGYLSLEIFNDQFRGGSARAVAKDGHRSLVHLMDQVSRESGLGRAPARPLPDRSVVHAVEFVEFAADERRAAALGSTLQTLGFRKAGRHRSKSVDLFRQGQINLVVNTEQEGQARSAFLAHGTAAYAIGLQVDDARATLARAVALGAEPFDQDPNPGDIRLPGIRGIGGSVIYFIDRSPDLVRLWEHEFVNVADGAAPTDAGLERIDHVAQTMFVDELLTSLLFYTSLFDVRKLPMVDVVDPGGLVRSQVIENEQGGLRLTLNGAENRRTLAGFFVSELFGAGIQHLAFATGDMKRTAQALAANGFQPLRVSANYYDDLAARFGLPAAEIEALKAAGILYDRDAGGEFFQLYGRTGEDGFFFEVVERRGYTGYGAFNAPFRIAAQKRHLAPTTLPRPLARE
ncbi:MAG: bifunctional sugar phosphate isomerase/epimerase/4-hydroxyphenylpyruvate dioxygenase family protein [Phreatobacter sp.]|uniref:bifunctional sugar phosphate isomerase/epimerase/4-hydroxyphenylpyruvate dioxygenase family protein n=1 Tax=Phreatobacter sp. TaxID=1966341 RepID=UPI0040362F0C